MRFFTTLSFLLFASVALMAQGFAYLNLTTADGAGCERCDHYGEPGACR